MKKTILYFMVACLALACIGCSKDTQGDDPTPPVVATSEEVVSGKIEKNTTWTADKHWILDGVVKVENGAVLTIEPGTIVKGKYNTKATLVVLRGGKMMAEGTENHPIVFTSDRAPGKRKAGDWGGILLCGKAKNNLYHEAQPDALQPEGGIIDKDICYGGLDDNDNSGVMKYVRIEFAGYVFKEGNEINGFTLCAVGKGTKISHIQVSYSNDDSYEWFGGAVNCDHLVSYCGLDDDFDTDNGFSGLVQYGLILRHPDVADVSNSNSFESDNCADGNAANKPLTSAVFTNISSFGPLKTKTTSVNSKHQFGVQIRRSSSISIFNSVFAGYVKGIILDTEKAVGGSTQANATAGDLVINNVFIAGCMKTFSFEKEKTADVDTTFTKNYFMQASRMNKVYAENSELLLNDKTFDFVSPSFLPKAGSPLLDAGNAGFSHAKLAGADQSATYVGAFKDFDWTAGWCQWDPQNADYSLKQ